MKLKLASIALLSVALMATACSNNDNSTASNSNEKSSQTEKSSTATTKESSQASSTASSDNTSTSSQDTTGSIKLSQQDAINKFHSQFGNKKIHSIDLKLEGNQYVYEIDGFDSSKEYSVDINAETGHASKVHSEKLDHDDKNKKELNLNGIISRDEASSIAEKHAKGTSMEWSLEQEGNNTYWDVKVGQKHSSTEVKINAHTKKVVSVENDD